MLVMIFPTERALSAKLSLHQSAEKASWLLVQTLTTGDLLSVIQGQSSTG